MTDLIGTVLGKYQLVSRVGRGGMARVYKAYQPSLDRHVALKVLHAHLAEDGNFVDRFEREATAIARLRHPGIVQVYDYDRHDELYYIVMEFVEGPTLKAELSERIKRKDPESKSIFSFEEIIRIFINLADAIDYAHSRGMIHRDIKPGNIMFTSDGQILLTDFGLARMVYSKRQTRTGALSGTPAYMSPEQVQGGHVDQRSDIYSLGVILYELFSGSVPFTAETPYAIMTKHVTDEVPSIRETNPDFPVEIETVILKSLSKDPDSRYQTANAFASDLQAAVGIEVSPRSLDSSFSPQATMADSQEMMPISTYTGMTTTSLAEITSPYRGLFAFREEDAPYFFGRESFSDRLVVTLNDKSMAAVVGPSGSGKSSVVFAGLLPRLRDRANWQIVEMRPGSEPYHSLASAYVGLLEPDLPETDRLIETKKLASALKENDLSLVDVIVRLKKNSENGSFPLLVVDQFEELYTLCRDIDVRRSFPNVLFEVIDRSRERSDLDFSLVITLRADFMGQALTNRPFADALQDADVKLGPMTKAELARAIESPAAKKRVVFEAGLVDRILDDVGDEPGNLPLLEFALTLLWDRRTGRRMTHAAYEAIGRVEGALARYADEIYEQLTTVEQDRARRVFTQMVRPGEGTEDTRRLAHRDELSDEDWSLVQRLANARLVITGRSPEGDETVEVVHEALIRGWGRLREWMNSERAFRSWQERLRVAQHQWEDSTRDEGALLRGAPLAEAKEWLNQKYSDLSVSEQTYINQSIEWQERREREREAQRQRELDAAKQLAEEQQLRAESEFQRAEDQVRATRNLRALAAILAAIFVVAVVAAVLAVEQSQTAEREANARATEVIVRTTAEAEALVSANIAATRAAESAEARDIAEVERSRANDAAESALDAKNEAETERDRADEQATLALARQLAAQSTTLLGSQLDLALLLGLEANRTINSAETQSSILSALQFNPTLLTYLRAHPTLLQSVDFSDDGKYLVSAGGNGLVYLWDLAKRKVINEYIGHDPTQLVNRAVFSPDGELIATASDDTTVIVWDVASGAIVHSLTDHTAWAQSVDFSPDGSLLVSGSGDRNVIVWDVTSGEALMTLSGHSGPLWDTVFSPDGSKIASASGDGSVKVWDVESGEQLLSIVAHNGASFHADFSPDGQLLATGGGDNLINLWETATGEQLGDSLVGHQAGAVSVEFSPDGTMLVSSSGDSTVRLWDIDSRQQIQLLADHAGLVPLVTFNNEGDTLASGDAAGTLILWDLSGDPAIGTNFIASENGISDVAVDPNRGQFASAGADSTIRFWDLETGIQIGEPITHGLRINEPIISLDYADDRLLISGSSNGTVKVWDFAIGEPVGDPFSILVNGVTSLQTSPDLEFVVAGSKIGFTGIWDRESGNQIGPFLSGHSGAITAISISSDSQTMATGGSDGAIIPRNVADILAGQAVGIPTTILTYEWSRPLEISELAFVDDGANLLAADTVGNITLWEYQSGQLVDQISLGDGAAITTLVERREGGYFASTQDGEIFSIVVNDLRLETDSIVGIENGIWALAQAIDSDSLYAVDETGEVVLFDIASDSFVSLWQVPDVEFVTSVEIDPDDMFIILGNNDGTIQILDLMTGEQQLPKLSHQEPFLGNVTTVTYSPDGNMIASAGTDSAVVLWGTEDRRPLSKPLLGHTGVVVNLNFSHSGEYLASSSCSNFHVSGNCIGGEVIIRELNEFEPVTILTGTLGFGQALDFSPDDRLIAVTDCSSVEVAGVCLAGVVRIINWRSGETVARLEGHTSFIWSADFSPDGGLLASSSADNTIIIWDLETGMPVGQRLSNHGGPVRRIAFSPDGERIASASIDNTVLLWDVASGQAIGGPLVTYTNNAMDLAFSPDGKRLVSSSLDGSVSIFDISLESWRMLSCNIANRNMRSEEWELFLGQIVYREVCPRD